MMTSADARLGELLLLSAASSERKERSRRKPNTRHARTLERARGKLVVPQRISAGLEGVPGKARSGKTMTPIFCYNVNITGKIDGGDIIDLLQ